MVQPIKVISNQLWIPWQFNRGPGFEVDREQSTDGLCWYRGGTTGQDGATGPRAFKVYWAVGVPRPSRYAVVLEDGNRHCRKDSNDGVNSSDGAGKTAVTVLKGEAAGKPSLRTGSQQSRQVKCVSTDSDDDFFPESVKQHTWL
jgi:hypothetical protein